jgi:DNA polymerase-1
VDTLYLVDGSNFLFRAFHALPPMSTRDGTPTGAVFGMTNMLLRLIEDRKPSHMAVIFDAGGRSERSEIFPEYKANRPECPPELVPQFDLSRRLLRALGLPVLDARDVEADDLIATLARRAQRGGLRVVIVSSDKDLMQLVQGDEITLHDTMKEGGKGKSYGPAEVEEKFGVPPAQLGDVLALMGDSIDNVPGVPGVGEKTAAALIKQFGSLPALLDHIDDIKIRGADRIKAALRERREQVLLSRRLVALDEQVDTPLTLDDLRRRPQQPELEPLLRQLEFLRILARLGPQGGASSPGPGQGSSGPAQAASPAAVSAAPGAGFALLPPEIVMTPEQLLALASSLRERAAGGLAVAFPLSGHAQEAARTAPPCGVALFAPGGPPAYVPLSHRYLGVPTQLGLAQVREVLAPLLADPALPKYVNSAKDALLSSENLGLKLAGIVSDPALCSYLLDAGAEHALPALCQQHLGVNILDRATLGQGSSPGKGRRAVDLESVEIAQVAACAAAEAQATLRLGQDLRARLSPESRVLLDEMELPLAGVLSVIERHGVLLDVAVLRQLSTEVSGQLRALEEDIAQKAGSEVNLGSPKQLGELLFVKLGLPPVKKTKTGYSTDAEVLETLAADHPIARQIHEHRGLAKLKNTYIDQLPLLVDERTGRLHTSYNQVVAATGRLSSTEPNLQNVPIRTELGRRIRRAFIAPPGHVLIAADYSQIELRILAHLSRDPLLLQSFQSGEDVHERTAIEMFGPETGARPEMRRVAKMINYGIAYGLSDYGLAVRLGIDRGEARRYIQQYLARYKGVKEYMDRLVLDARRDGGARTLQGRFRPLPDIAHKSYPLRAAAERMAKNTPIQGTAADILKRAMIRVQERLLAEAKGVRMLLTVHDELVLEAPQERAEAAAALAKEAMEGAFRLDVPLLVDVGIGANWADC